MTAAPDASRRARVEHLGREVAGEVSPPGAVDFALSARGGLGAWSWPDGRIRVSRALVDLLDDDELRAALAHEVGHLLDGGHVVGGPASLRGSHGAAGVEARADVLGCRLLRARGAPTEALPRMLRRLAASLGAGADGPDPALLLRRAAAAEGACAAA
jgi:Zn-dependent protease with chaperone function